MPLLQRFWKRVEKSDGCWLWTGYLNKWGYGRFRGPDGRKILTHRFSWELHYGPVPPDMLVLHHCDVPACVNPDHLFLGTDADNCHDRDRKWRLAHKLTEDQIRTIRVLRKSLTEVEVAAMFNITRANVGAIHRRQTWKDIR